MFNYALFAILTIASGYSTSAEDKNLFENRDCTKSSRHGCMPQCKDGGEPSIFMKCPMGLVCCSDMPLEVKNENIRDLITSQTQTKDVAEPFKTSALKENITQDEFNKANATGSAARKYPLQINVINVSGPNNGAKIEPIRNLRQIQRILKSNGIQILLPEGAAAATAYYHIKIDSPTPNNLANVMKRFMLPFESPFVRINSEEPSSPIKEKEEEKTNHIIEPSNVRSITALPRFYNIKNGISLGDPKYMAKPFRPSKRPVLGKLGKLMLKKPSQLKKISAHRGINAEQSGHHMNTKDTTETSPKLNSSESTKTAVVGPKWKVRPEPKVSAIPHREMALAGTTPRPFLPSERDTNKPENIIEVTGTGAGSFSNDNTQLFLNTEFQPLKPTTAATIHKGEMPKDSGKSLIIPSELRFDSFKPLSDDEMKKAKMQYGGKAPTISYKLRFYPLKPVRADVIKNEFHSFKPISVKNLDNEKIPIFPKYIGKPLRMPSEKSFEPLLDNNI